MNLDELFGISIERDPEFERRLKQRFSFFEPFVAHLLLGVVVFAVGFYFYPGLLFDTKLFWAFTGPWVLMALLFGVWGGINQEPARRILLSIDCGQVDAPRLAEGLGLSVWRVRRILGELRRRDFVSKSKDPQPLYHLTPWALENLNDLWLWEKRLKAEERHREQERTAQMLKKLEDSQKPIRREEEAREHGFIGIPSFESVSSLDEPKPLYFCIRTLHGLPSTIDALKVAAARSEEDLVATIQQDLTEEEWRRYRHLVDNRKEHDLLETSVMTLDMETMNVQRLAALVELAKRRHMSVDDLIDQIDPGSRARYDAS